MLYHYTRPALCSLAAWSLLSTPALADAPRVVTDIPPVQSLAAMVMGDLGSPDVIVPATASPHGFSMRPSQAAALDSADLVFWMGHELTPWLEKSLETLAQGAEVTALLDVDGTQTYTFRSIGNFGKHGEHHDEHEDHNDHAEHDDHDDHDDHAKHEEHDDHDDHAKHEEHDDHDDHAGHEEHDDHGQKKEDKDHDHNHAHDHDGVDPHAWLDPENAVVWVEYIAKQLTETDPENAATYAQNAQDAVGKIRAASAQIKPKMAALSDKNFIVFHDAYQYFETRYGLQAAGSISFGDASQPSPAQLAEIRETLKAQNVTCVFTEAQFNSGLVETVSEGSDVRSAEIDPLGANQTQGPDLYLGVLNGLADQFSDCLKP